MMMPTPTRTKRRTAAAFSFEEFYRAFSKSVPADVTFEDGEIQVVRAPAAAQAAQDVRQSSTDDDPASRTHKTPAALDLPLPTHIAALMVLQEVDGSWKFSPEFTYVINGVAPAPMDGISPKTWATCVCICIWRQSPECFAQLEASYGKAMLHCDDDVLRRVQALIDFDALDHVRNRTLDALIMCAYSSRWLLMASVLVVFQIRMYNDGEARRIRELMAKEAAAKRALEDAEYDRLTREREEIELVTEFSVENARRLPAKTQSVFVKGMRSEVRDVFRSSASAALLSSSKFQSGEVVECCWRRPSRTAHACKQNDWHACTVCE